jgi:hypothetical protein
MTNIREETRVPNILPLSIKSTPFYIRILQIRLHARELEGLETAVYFGCITPEQAAAIVKKSHTEKQNAE